MASSAPRRCKNVIFITMDQFRAGCLTNPAISTPHFDALAAESTVFHRHYANTTPCGPSRASLHTGLYLKNHRSGSNGAPLDARHTNWALELRRHGYRPALLGYTDTSADPRAYDAGDAILRHHDGPLPGIEPVIDWMTMGDANEAWASWLREKGYQVPESAFASSNVEQDTGDLNWSVTAENCRNPCSPAFYAAEHSDTAFLVGKAIDYLGARRGAPFALHLSVLRPHPPWVAAAPYNDMYSPEDLPCKGMYIRASSRENEAALHPWLAWQFDAKRAGSNRPVAETDGFVGVDPPNGPSPPDTHMSKLRAVYYGLVSECDAQVGRLLGFLRERGLLESTLVVLTSDHGEQLGDHHLTGKLGFFDQSYHIPLIIRDPEAAAAAALGHKGGQGQRQRRDLHCFTEHVDIMPTILDALGLPVPVECDGRSLVPLLREQDPESAGGALQGWRQACHYEVDFRKVLDPEMEERFPGLTMDQCHLSVIRSDRWKYVHFAADSIFEPILFDLESDPDETRNVARDPACAGALVRCMREMLSWSMVHLDQRLTHTMLTPYRGPVHREQPRYHSNGSVRFRHCDGSQRVTEESLKKRRLSEL